MDFVKIADDSLGTWLVERVEGFDGLKAKLTDATHGTEGHLPEQKLKGLGYGGDSEHDSASRCADPAPALRSRKSTGLDDWGLSGTQPRDLTPGQGHERLTCSKNERDSPISTPMGPESLMHVGLSSPRRFEMRDACMTARRIVPKRGR
jgi:hypothetical protein